MTFAATESERRPNMTRDEILEAATGLHHDDNYVDIAGYAACAGAWKLGADKEV